MKNTMRRIASVAGVSAASVSRYINGNEEVSDELRKKIKAAMEELGCADRVVGGQKKTIMVLVQDLSQPFFSAAMRYLYELGGEDVSLILVRYEEKKIEEIKAYIRRTKLAGLIYFEEEMNRDILKYAQEYGIRTVVCGGTTLDTASTVIRVNDILAAYDGTRYLLGLGHRKIVFMSDFDRKIGTGFQRITGCKKAMEEAGLTIPEEMILYADMNYDEGYRIMSELLKKTRDFTAVFAFCDEMAMGAMTAMFDAGIYVPKDVSVLGFDDIPSSRRIRPKLTTVHQPIEDFARTSLEVLRQSPAGPCTEILLRHSIIERQSCRKIEVES